MILKYSLYIELIVLLFIFALCLFFFIYFINDLFFLSLLCLPFILNVFIGLGNQTNHGLLQVVRQSLWKYIDIESKRKFYIKILIWLADKDLETNEKLEELKKLIGVDDTSFILLLQDSLENEFVTMSYSQWYSLAQTIYIKYGCNLNSIVVFDIENRYGSLPVILKILWKKDEIINRVENVRFRNFINR